MNTSRIGGKNNCCHQWVNKKPEIGIMLFILCKRWDPRHNTNSIVFIQSWWSYPWINEYYVHDLIRGGGGTVELRYYVACVRSYKRFFPKNRGLRRCWEEAEDLLTQLATLALVLFNFLLPMFCSSRRRQTPELELYRVYCRVLKYRAPLQTPWQNYQLLYPGSLPLWTLGSAWKVDSMQSLYCI
jgi:hypothetical protein